MYTITSTEKPPLRFVLVFLLLHGVLFLGVEYILFLPFPLFTLIHAVIGVGIYLLFWRGQFPHLFRDALMGAIISVAGGLFFGDLILDNFFFAYPEAPSGIIARIYSAVVVFYLYFYVQLVRRKLFT